MIFASKVLVRENLDMVREMQNIGKVVMVVAVAGLALSAVARMPRNSYLVRPASTKAELISQVKSERVVMDRYTRHFSMSEQEVIDYLETLRLGRLERTGVYTVFGVPRNGKIHVSNQTIRKGSLVWFDSAGQAALLEVCGNPMNLGPKRMTMANLVTPSSATQSASSLVAMSTIPADPIVAAPVIQDMTPVTPIAPPIPEVAPGVVSRSTNLLPLLIPAGIIAASIDDGGEEPVPEPATMTAIGVGLAALAARKRRKNSK